jgi:hypothetical protein
MSAATTPVHVGPHGLDPDECSAAALRPARLPVDLLLAQAQSAALDMTEAALARKSVGYTVSYFDRDSAAAGSIVFGSLKEARAEQADLRAQGWEVSEPKLTEQPHELVLYRGLLRGTEYRATFANRDEAIDAIEDGTVSERADRDGEFPVWLDGEIIGCVRGLK